MAQDTILVLGDSLSAGYGIPREVGWVALLEERLSAEGYGYQVVNASISGDTTRGGLARLPRALDVHAPEIVIIALGGNDGLRGIPVDVTRDNLSRMAERIREAGARALIAGVLLPPNYGPEYTERFRRLFLEVGETEAVPVLPFILEGVAEDPALMQDDGIHPNEAGQPVILENVWEVLVPLLDGGGPECEEDSQA